MRNHFMAAVVCALVPAAGWAQTNWNTNSSGFWNNNANWTANFPNGNGSQPRFGTLVTEDITVTLGQNITFGSVVFENFRGGYTLDGGNTNGMNQQPSGGTSLRVGAGALGGYTIKGMTNFAPNGVVTFANQSSFSTLQLENNYTLPGTLSGGGAGEGTIVLAGTNLSASQAVTLGAGRYKIRDVTALGGTGEFAVQGGAVIMGMDAPLDLSTKNFTSQGGENVYFGGDQAITMGNLVPGASSRFLYSSNSELVTIGDIGISSGNQQNSLRFFGTGDFLVRGSITNGGTNTRLVFIQTMGSSVTFAGTNSGINNVVLGSGELILDYSNNTGNKLPTGTNALYFGGGELTVLGNNSQGITQSVNGITDGSIDNANRRGASRFTVVSGTNQAAELDLNLISRSSSTLDFHLVTNGVSGAPTIKVANANNSRGILGGWATLNGNTWAVRDNTTSNIVGFTGYATSITADTNVTLAAGATAGPNANTSLHTLRFAEAGAANLNLGTGNVNIATGVGGILVTSNVGANDVTITQTGVGVLNLNAETVIQQHNTNGALVLDTRVGGGASLIKAGAGTLVLLRSNSMAGSVQLFEGTIQIGDDNALGTGQLNFRDFEGKATLEAINGARTIANGMGGVQTTGSSINYGVRFAGTNAMTFTAEANFGSDTRPDIITMDADAAVTFSNRVYLSDNANGARLILQGDGSGDLVFADSFRNNGQTAGGVVIDRTEGATYFNAINHISGSSQSVRVEEGILVLGTTSVVNQSTFTAVLTSNSAVIGVSDASGLVVGQRLVGTGIPGHAYITAIDGTNVTLRAAVSTNTTSTVTGAGASVVGSNAAFVAASGVLELGVNGVFQRPGGGSVVDANSSGAIGIGVTNFDQNLDFATLGNRAMWLGSGTGGRIVGGTITPGTNNAYRFGGGGNELVIEPAGYLTGACDVIVGESGLFKGDQTRITLAGNQDFTGRTFIRAGTLQLGEGGATGAIGTNTVYNDATLVFNRSNTYDFGNTMLGTGRVIQAGSGVANLTGANTYSGGTYVSNGTLLANNATGSATGTNFVNVYSGGALGGTGTIAGAVSVLAGGTMRPGNSPGTLAISNDLDLAAGSFAEFEINGTNAGQFDRVVGILDLDYGGTLTLNIGMAVVGGESWDLFDFGFQTNAFAAVNLTNLYSGAFSLAGDLWTLNDGSFDWSFNEVDGILSVAVIPEPSTVGMLLMGGLALLAGCRRRR